MGALGKPTAKQIYSFFRDRFPTFQDSTNGWCGFKCPCGRSKDMAVHPEWELVKCWSAKCNYTKGRSEYKDDLYSFFKKWLNLSFGEAMDMLREYKEGDYLNFSQYDNEVISKVHGMTLPEGFVGLSERNDTLGNRARLYLLNRGMDIELLTEMGFGYVGDPDSVYYGYIIIPFKGRGNLYYWIARDFMGNFPKYLNPPKESVGVGKAELLFNEDALSKCSEVYLTEGWACAMTIGAQGIACLGSVLSPQQLSKIIRSQVTTVVIIPDYGFYENGKTMAAALVDHKRVYLANLDAIGSEELNDVNSLGIEPVMEHINSLTEFTETDLFSWDDDPPFI